MILANSDAMLKAYKHSLDLDLDPSNADYSIYSKEIESLKNSNYGLEEIDFDQNSKLAPNLYPFIQKITKDFATQTNIKMPKIVLYVGKSEKTYNASATNLVNKIIETTTITKGNEIKSFKKEKLEKNFTLTLGEGLLRLLLWSKDAKDLISGIIAHEIGHMYYCHVTQSKEDEFQADAKAIDLIGKSNGEKLLQAISMATLGGHIYNILTANSSLFKLSIDDINYLIRIINNNIVQSFPDLKDLGNSSSHTKFGFIIHKIFKDALDGFFDRTKGLTEHNLERIYEKLNQACLESTIFMGSEESDYQTTVKCEDIEAYTSKFYSPITHPTPFQRASYIKKYSS
ncbi:hypothetical protein ACFLYH_02105 [Candidatus Dependentiae bacterium]